MGTEVCEFYHKQAPRKTRLIGAESPAMVSLAKSRVNRPCYNGHNMLENLSSCLRDGKRLAVFLGSQREQKRDRLLGPLVGIGI